LQRMHLVGCLWPGKIPIRLMPEQLARVDLLLSSFVII
jgi:hypothetical protein